MKVKTKTIPSDDDAKALAREFYKKLEMKEAAKRKASHQSSATTGTSSTPPTPSAAPETRKSPRKATKAPCKNTAQATPNKGTPTKNDDANLRARQFYDNFVVKIQAKKDQLHTSSPKIDVPKTNVTPSATTYTFGAPATSSCNAQKTTYPYKSTSAVSGGKNSRTIDTLYNDMFKLEQKEATESLQKNQTTSMGSKAGTMPSQPTTNLFWGTGNNFSIPETKNISSCSNPFLKENTASIQKPLFTTVPATTSSLPPPPPSRAASNTIPIFSEIYQDDHTKECGWLGRLFTTFDVITFVLMYMLEMNFHILSFIGVSFIRFVMYCVWKTMVLTYQHGLDISNMPTTLIISLCCCIVVRYSIRPSTILLQSFRKNRKIRNDRIRSDVVVVLNMVYNELMKQHDVNVPIQTLQDMTFAQLFVDESIEHEAKHNYILNVTKDRKYWIQIIWPRVVAQLLYRNPNVIVLRSTFQNDKETYVRWRASAGSDPNIVNDCGVTHSNVTYKKRKAV